MNDKIYFIPKSFPCEICEHPIEVKVPHGTNKFPGFKCEACGLEQRITYYGKYFAVITGIKN